MLEVSWATAPQLPASPGWESPFVGRQAELDRVLSRLQAGERLISILGPPGMGKTRLARQVLARLRGANVGCAQIDAAACRGVDEIQAQLILCLGGALDAPDGDARDGVRRTLAKAGPAVVLIDNLETIVDEAAPELERWLACSAEIQLLVTSRVRLRVAPEFVLDLGSLDVGAGEALFEHCARRASAGFTLGADERPIVRELVGRLDGLPLAIELAAARSRVFRPSDLLRRSAVRLELTSPPSRGTSRGTLMNAIASSFDALSGEAQRALCYLSVLATPADLETTLAVVAASDHDGSPSATLADRALEELVDASLVRAVQDEERDELQFSLYESIRELAALRLDRLAVRPAAERAVADRLLIMAERLAIAGTGPDAVDGLERLTRVREELRLTCEREIAVRPDVAARFTLALHVLALARGPIDAQHALIERVLAALRPPEHAPLLARLHAACGYLCFLRGQMERACEHLPIAYTLASELGLSEVAGEARSTLLLTTQWKGEASEGTAEAARDLSSFSLFTLGLRALHHGDTESASDLLLRARDVGLAAGHHRDAARTLGLYGLTRHELGKLDAADKLFEQATVELDRVGDRHFAAVITLWRGLLTLERGDVEAALRELAEAELCFERVGDPFFEAAARGYRGLALLFARRADEARESIGRALPVLRGADDTYRLGIFLPLHGAACALCGDAAQARAAFAEARLVAGRAASPNVGVVGNVLEGFLELDAADERGVEQVDQRLLRARGPLRAASGAEHGSLTQSSTDVRFAIALLARARSETCPSASRPTVAPTTPLLVVSRDGAWFQVDGRNVDLRRRQPLCRLLARLVDHHQRAPGAALPTAALIGAGWPGERMLAAAGANRVHVAIATLRRMGLGHRITRAEGGYLIPREVQVSDSAEPTPPTP